MVGESYVMQQLREQIAMAAPTNGRVLIYGENGTGKELVARSVHALSRRRSGPFVEVNCAAIPEELIESELFGHMRGAFTGALSDRRGKFELADGGTLFLDEIGDMSLKTQAKVLRALQEQVVEPVGGAASVRVDVRVLAATNKELPAEIRAGPVPRGSVLPAQRHSDLRAAAARPRRTTSRCWREHFMTELSREYGRRPKTVRRGRGGRSAQLPLAGQRARAAQRGRAADDHGAGRHHPAVGSVIPGRGGARRPRTSRRPVAPLHEARDASSASTSCKALAAQHGNISRTADVLGVERSNLYRKMRGVRHRTGPPRRGRGRAGIASGDPSGSIQEFGWQIPRVSARIAFLRLPEFCRSPTGMSCGPKSCIVTARSRDGVSGSGSKAPYEDAAPTVRAGGTR